MTTIQVQAHDSSKPCPIASLPLELQSQILACNTEDAKISEVCKAWQAATEHITYKQELLKRYGVHPDRVDTHLHTYQIHKIIFISQAILPYLRKHRKFEATDTYVTVQEAAFNQSATQVSINDYLLGLFLLSILEMKTVEKIKKIASFDNLTPSTETFSGMLYHVQISFLSLDGREDIWTNFPKSSHSLFPFAWYSWSDDQISNLNPSIFSIEDLTHIFLTAKSNMKEKLLMNTPGLQTRENIQILYNLLKPRDWDKAKSLLEIFREKLSSDQVCFYLADKARRSETIDPNEQFLLLRIKLVSKLVLGVGLYFCCSVFLLLLTLFIWAEVYFWSLDFLLADQDEWSLYAVCLNIACTSASLFLLRRATDLIETITLPILDKTLPYSALLLKKKYQNYYDLFEEQKRTYGKGWPSGAWPDELE